MTLTVCLTDPSRGIDVAFSAESGSVTAILGPNGAGKSTVLDAIAGVHSSDGEVVLGGRRLTGVRAHRRGVSLLDQDATLFPHLTVLDNVAFAPRCAGKSRAESRRLARKWLAMVGVERFESRKPSQLSGGQAQRVAIARALAAEPALILLDEPMAALDATAVPEVRAVLRHVLRTPGLTALLVTHDPLDAMVLADHVIVIEDGRVAEFGLTREVLTRPRSSFAAQLAGVNLVAGTVVSEATLDTPIGTVFGVSDEILPVGAAAFAAFTPAAVSVFLETPHGSPRNHFAVTVSAVEPHGSGVRVRAGDLMADISLASAAELELAPGSDVHFIVKAAETQLYELGQELR